METNKRKTWRRVPIEEEEEIIRLYRAGISHYAAGEALGRHERTILDVLRRRGVVPPCSFKKRRRTKRDKVKTCLKCDKVFISKGKWNRLCENCNERNTEHAPDHHELNMGIRGNKGGAE